MLQSKDKYRVSEWTEKKKKERNKQKQKQKQNKAYLDAAYKALFGHMSPADLKGGKEKTFIMTIM